LAVMVSNFGVGNEKRVWCTMCMRACGASRARERERGRGGGKVVPKL
jgi:hypothetical protein